jgi:CheY-like chemotaxis protein
MNGKLGFTNTPNNTVYWIELPGIIARSSHNKHGRCNTAHNKTPTDKPDANFHILVAEDNSTNLKLILSQLEILGYNADQARNGFEALNKMINNNYHLLLTDCNMPVIDGYNLTKTIRRSGNDKTPIIALTADAFPQTRSKCIKAGMDDHITKPANLATMKSTLEKYLQVNND